MVRVLAITGDQLRHRHLVEILQKSGVLVGWIAEQREPFMPSIPIGLDANLQKLFLKHFTNRLNAEERFFAPTCEIGTPKLIIDKFNLNSIETIKYINNLSPDLVISYGCHKLSSELISSCTSIFWNTHGGLSPDYRGVITHFWPSYNLEPQMTGMTLHQTTSEIDGGTIFHQSAADLVPGYGLHDLAARAVRKFCEELPRILESIDKKGIPDGVEQKFSGRVYRSIEWRPDHLKVIYELFNDSIVDLTISGEIQGRIPHLISVF